MATPGDRQSLLESIDNLRDKVKQLPSNIFEDPAARQQIQQQITQLRNAVSSPFERVFIEICFQPHQSAAVRTALEGKWFEALADGKPRTAQEIGKMMGAEPELVVRIMMVLTATEVVKENGPQTYSATPITQLLCDEGWANGLRHFFDHCGPSMINLPSYLQRNGYKVPQDVKTGPFADAWGGRNTWALYEDEPLRGQVFNSFMTKWRQGTSLWTDLYPAKTLLCDTVDKFADAVLMVDIGGGSGHVLTEFAKDPAHRTGRLILQDLPSALGDAELLKSQGIEAMGYDFFTSQPVTGAKAYYLRGILHDWPDRACREILGNTAKAMRKGYSKLLVDEMALPDTNIPPKGALFDLSMLALETGAERTSSQWHSLLASVGLQITKIWNTRGGLESIIEAELRA